jgi:Protein of unknown function (DUF3179)
MSQLTRRAALWALLFTALWAGAAQAQERATTSKSPAASGPPAQGKSGKRETPPADVPAVDDFFAAASLNRAQAMAARERLAAGWRDGYAAMLVDEIDLMRRTGFVSPQAWLQLAQLAQFLELQTHQSFGGDLDGWHRWVWSLPYDPHPDYGVFKGRLYAGLDPRFADFFRPPVRTQIRLDEVQWGGVEVNGIPPLDHPNTIAAADAGYLDDDNLVFGIYVDGEARAYPKRILAWHELALDRLGGRELTVVYCTLCGTVIPFESLVGGKVRKFGTSGLLYQSNKLMFDAATKSLWSSISGAPVVGPLVGSGLQLRALPVVTTTWGEWRRRHPDTTTLSLDTGYERDYSEGAAYRAYFSTDALMFDVSRHDARLPNKAQVLVLRPQDASGAAVQPIAISADLLLAKRVFEVDDVTPKLVVVTDHTGANRVYESGSYRFEAQGSDDDQVLDSEGRAWKVTEDALEAAFAPSLTLPRVPAHRSFWFGWYAQHPETTLVK